MKQGDILELQISSYAFGGKGISKIHTEQGDLVAFVENTFPGQKVKVKVEKKTQTTSRM